MSSLISVEPFCSVAVTSGVPLHQHPVVDQSESHPSPAGRRHGGRGQLWRLQGLGFEPPGVSAGGGGDEGGTGGHPFQHGGRCRPAPSSTLGKRSVHFCNCVVSGFLACSTNRRSNPHWPRICMVMMSESLVLLLLLSSLVLVLLSSNHERKTISSAHLSLLW